MTEQKPSVGRMVHYVLGGVETPAAHRAAVVGELHDDGTLELAVLLPLGWQVLPRVTYDEEGRPGTWHWPERV
jgi:YD repeat-containing protein